MTRADSYQNDTDAAVATLSRAVHALPESTHLRLDLMELLLKVDSTHFSSTADNLEIASRLLAEETNGAAEFPRAADRARLMVARAIIRFQLKKEKLELEDGGEGRGSVVHDGELEEIEETAVEGIRLLEKAIFLNPSDQALRRKLENHLKL